jgi:DNA helicase INO80
VGLGKTIQSIAFLSYLAEVKDVWGPFLIIAPLSTLHNWCNELSKFCPALKVLPYWGTQKERATLRKLWNPKHLYSQESPFHIVVSSYNLVIFDEKYLHKIKWQYMVLDEAQALKSFTTIRWKTFSSFSCRNRLLLTGTPVQNSMQEVRGI